MTEATPNTIPAPLSGAVRPVSFPQPEVIALRSGTVLYAVRNPRLPYISLQIVFRSGACHDGALLGLAEFTATMLLSGAGERDARVFAEQADALGATLDATAGHEDTVVRLGILSEHLPIALDLVADMIRKPMFLGDEVERQRRHGIAVLRQNMSDPAYVAATTFRSQLYGDVPYGNQVEGTEQTLSRITRDDIVRFHAAHYTPHNAFIVATGDLRPEELSEMLNQRLEGWGESVGSVSGLEFPDQYTNRRRVVLVHKPDATQSSLMIGGFGIPRRDPRYASVLALNTIFGGYFNSRINMNLRERHGFTYGARSVIDTPSGCGMFAVSVSVGQDVTRDAIRETLRELHTISSEPVSGDELVTVANYIAGGMALQAETSGQITRAVRHLVYYGLPFGYYNSLVEEIGGLTSEQLLSVARQIMQPDRMLIVVAGNAELLADELAEFGTVETV